MHYEEKVINGILHHRSTPRGEWVPFTVEQLTKKVKELKKSNAELHEACAIMSDRLDNLKYGTVAA